MKIVELEKQHVPDVALLHKKYIDRGFMSSLGSSFLEHLYDAMTTSGNACCLVAEENGEIHGFISGTCELRSFYRDFVKAKLLPVSLLLMPMLLKPSFSRKIMENFIYPSKQGDLPGAEIMSIVVSEKFRGRGVSESLFNSLLEEFRLKHVRRFKVTVGSSLPAANRFYQKMGGMSHAEIEVHNNEISRVYIWEI
jgi:ribosomal protein S18 acetylase RimI-like enzyme